MSQRSPEDFRQAVAKVQSLYSTPQVLSKALQLLRNPDVDLGEVTDLVRRDPALSADLLHLSNSALYSRGGECADLQLAVQRLGMKEVLRAIGLSLSKNIFGKGLANYGITAPQYWNLSILAGLLMERLAQRGSVEPGEAYLVGILHAIGRVLINEALQELGCRERWDGVTALESWELEHVGFTHAEAGALLLTRWAFPENIRQPVANQFGPITSAGSSSLTGLLRFALSLLQSSGALHPADALASTISRQTLVWAGFQDLDELQGVLADVKPAFEKVQASIGVAP